MWRALRAGLCSLRSPSRCASRPFGYYPSCRKKSFAAATHLPWAPTGASIPRMCNLYSVTTAQEAKRRLFRVEHDLAGNLPALAAVFPDYEAPIVRIGADGKRELVKARWGFPPPPNFGNRPVTNVRNLKSPYWRTWLKPEWRCLVPANSFCEYSDTLPKIPNWFALGPDRQPFAFAGIWRRWTGQRRKETRDHELFSFLTCAPNAVVKPVHAKAMPVMLTTPEEQEAWLTSSVEQAVAMQSPLPPERLQIVATGKRQDQPEPLPA